MTASASKSITPSDPARSLEYPRISIVTPSYNQAQYIEATLLSVLSQNYPNLEYIVIDGGSTDASPAIIEKYASRLAYWISEKDHGQAEAINKGFSRATGDILAYINSDDLLEPGSLNKVARAYRDGCDWIVGSSRFIQEGKADHLVPPNPWRDRVDWLLHNYISQPSTFWTRKLYQLAGPFRQDMHYAFDYEYWMRFIFVLNVMPSVIDDCLAVFRLHEQSKTVSQASRFEADLAQILAIYRPKLTTLEKWPFVTRSLQLKSRSEWNTARAQLKKRELAGATRSFARSLLFWPPFFAGRPLSLLKRRGAPTARYDEHTR